jgi:hypothetical protein
VSKHRDQEQFDDYRNWQWCKHDVLRRYIEPWSVIVGKGRSEIVAVDARERERNPTREGYRPLEADSPVLAVVVQAEGEADDGFPGLPGHVDTYIRAV